MTTFNKACSGIFIIAATSSWCVYADIQSSASTSQRSNIIIDLHSDLHEESPVEEPSIQTVQVIQDDVVMDEEHMGSGSSVVVEANNFLGNCGPDCTCADEGEECESDIDCCNLSHVCDTGHCEFEKP